MQATNPHVAAPVVVTHLESTGATAFVYRDGDRVEFRRSDHRAPKGLDVRHLVAVLTTDGPTGQLHCLPGHEVGQDPASAAVNWVQNEYQAGNGLWLELSPYQRDAAARLVDLDSASIHYALGTG